MGIVSLILIAGAIVLQFFVVLSGVRNTTPLNKTYFLQADTSSIAGSGRAISQWTYFYVCGAGNQDCGKPVPDLPFGYAWVGGSAGAPAPLIGGHGKDTTSTYYYYMWRFGWIFYLMGLFFTVSAFFTALLAPCSRLASGFSGFTLGFALFWFTLAAALMTTVFVKARDRFRDAGLAASIGRYAFGFTWGAWAAMFLATVFLFLGCGAGGRSDDRVRTTRGGTTGFFRRQRSRRSARGSFVDNESQRRVKDEYA
ncbi:hypothetical protein NA56DRAFT_583779 [Hyaloscypha hepaticicola]|uniref:SUR7-domain-containing protein n=1 Tax=Hyaloscypha hepaticicola TaxID=2082293 RepID=A0A2J6PKD2_9HELO|nr:hypothetical protein NA56DRAFT_583779 [Hyaloscypha hepaticicola]